MFFHRITLTMKEKEAVTGGFRLTDKHIHFAQSLIASRYPDIGGLRSTIL